MLETTFFSLQFIELLNHYNQCCIEQVEILVPSNCLRVMVLYGAVYYRVMILADTTERLFSQ